MRKNMLSFLAKFYQKAVNYLCFLMVNGDNLVSIFNLCSTSKKNHWEYDENEASPDYMWTQLELQGRL